VYQSCWVKVKITGAKTHLRTPFAGGLPSFNWTC